jgi:hypothetical protein
MQEEKKSSEIPEEISTSEKPSSTIEKNPNDPARTQKDDNKNISENKNPQEQRGQLSIFKILMFYFIFNQIVGLFFPANPKNNPNLLSNIYENGDPLV